MGRGASGIGRHTDPTMLRTVVSDTRRGESEEPMIFFETYIALLLAGHLLALAWVAALDVSRFLKNQVD